MPNLHRQMSDKCLQIRNVFCDYANDSDPILIEIDNEFPWGHECHRQVFPRGGNSLSYTFSDNYT